MMVRIVGALLVAIGGVELVPGLLRLPEIVSIILDGGMPLTDLRGIEGVASIVGSLGISALQVVFGVGLLRLRGGARLGAIGATAADLYLIGYWQLRAAFSPAIPSPGGAQLFTMVLLVLLEVAVLAVLNGPDARRDLHEPSAAGRQRHRARTATAVRIRDGWRSLGRGGDTVIVNIAPFSFIVAPFYWAAAAAFYLVVVLPFRPWGGD